MWMQACINYFFSFIKTGEAYHRSNNVYLTQLSHYFLISIFFSQKMIVNWKTKIAFQQKTKAQPSAQNIHHSPLCCRKLFYSFCFFFFNIVR